jgi:hypothetical protein
VVPLEGNTAYTFTRQRGNGKTDELAKHSIRHGKDSQIPIPAKDIESISRKISKEDFQM